MIDRRSAIASLAAAALVPHAAMAAVPRRLGIQLYMLGPEALRDLPATFAAVRDIGFTEIELPGGLTKPPADIGAMLRTAGLACPSVHVPLEGTGATLAAPDRIVDLLGTLGARYAIVSLPPIKPRLEPGESWFAAMARTAAAMHADEWRRIAERLDTAGAALGRQGFVAGYHNHDIELRAVADRAANALELLIAGTDPRNVVFEMDIGWVAAAGADPAALLRRHPGRFSLLHLKDTAARSVSGRAVQMTPAEPGQGIVDWQAVTRALRNVPVAHAFVEQEPPFTGPRIEAARRGFAWFEALFQRKGVRLPR